MRELRHRVLGANEVPAAVWVDTLDDALAILGKSREAKRFANMVERTRQRQPAVARMACPQAAQGAGAG